MNFNHLLSGAASRSDFIKNGDMGTQGFLRLGQKRGSDHLVDYMSASEVVTRRRLETDPKFQIGQLHNRPNLASLSPWENTSSSTPRFTQMASYGSTTTELRLGGATTEFPMLNHSAGILSLSKYSRSAKFAEMEARASSNISETKRLFDSLASKEVPRSGYGTYSSENGFTDSECNRQHLFSVYSRGLENMRQALGKDVKRSVEDKTQNEVQKFTLNGEPVDRITKSVLSDGVEEMPPPAPRLNTNHRGLYATPYYYEYGSLGSDKIMPPHPSSTLSRGFYRSSLPDRYNNSSIYGGNILNGSSTNLQMGRNRPGASTLHSFEATKAAMLEAMRYTGKGPAEAGTSKSVLKSVALRKKDRDNSNIFPANVKSLLSTGIFDGVAVKYVSWDRTKNVRGTIQGTGYLCWCKECKKLKMVNAYQLEQHAGSKSKHPNDHIYFSNGKSIYGVVQELKNTPSDKLLEVIPTVTGSGINKGNFSKWKESFQVAGRELQRIFGSDPEPGEPSSSRNTVLPDNRE